MITIFLIPYLSFFAGQRSAISCPLKQKGSEFRELGGKWELDKKKATGKLGRLLCLEIIVCSLQAKDFIELFISKPMCAKLFLFFFLFL